MTLVAGVLLALLLVFFATMTLVISWVDIRTKTIPNRIVLAATLAATGLMMAVTLMRGVADAGVRDRSTNLFGAQLPWWGDVLIALVSALGLALIYLVLALIAPGQLGGGDVKLALFVGLVTGFFSGLHGVGIATLVTFVLGGVFSLVLMARGRGRGTIPFAPFMFAGAWVVILGALITVP